MVVLKVIPSKWRLFWVLEAIGLSVTFAMLGLRTTGNGDEVAGDGHSGCNYSNYRGSKTPEEGCFIYGWHIILKYLPVSVTIVSLLLNAIVANPKRCIKRHVLRSNCWKEWLFALVLALWILEAMLDQFYFDAWKMEAKGLFLGTYATGLVTWGIFKAYKQTCFLRKFLSIDCKLHVLSVGFEIEHWAFLYSCRSVPFRHHNDRHSRYNRANGLGYQHIRSYMGSIFCPESNWLFVLRSVVVVGHV